MSEPQIRGSATCLMVSDVVRAQAYYAGKLGFEKASFWGDPPTFCIAGRDGFELMLAQADAGRDVHPNSEHEGRMDAYFWVRDADALYAEFTANGADVVCEPDDQPYGMREIWVRDPDGHILIFGHNIEGRA